MTFLLDANICIAAFRGNGDVRRTIAAHHPDDIYICSPVIAELYVGAYKSDQKRKNVLVETYSRHPVRDPWSESVIPY